MRSQAKPLRSHGSTADVDTGPGRRLDFQRSITELMFVKRTHGLLKERTVTLPDKAAWHC
jgi:hypothetical protein